MSQKKHRIALLILILLYSIMGSSMATSNNKPKNISFIKKSNGVEEYKLDNGLKVLLKQDINKPDQVNDELTYEVN